MNNLSTLDLLGLYLNPFLYDIHIHGSEKGRCCFSFHLIGSPFFVSKYFYGKDSAGGKEESLSAVSEILSETIEIGERLILAYPELASQQVFRKFSVEQKEIVQPKPMDSSLKEKIVSSLREMWSANMSTPTWREKHVA